MKLLYNKFVKAIAMLALIVVAFVALGGISALYYAYVNDIDGGRIEKSKSEIVESAISDASGTLHSLLMDEIYNNSGYYDEYGNYIYDSEDGEIDYDKVINEIIKDIEHKDYLNMRMNQLFVNYKYKVYYNDKIIISNIENEKEIEKVNVWKTEISDDVYFKIENYVNSELEKGDYIYKAVKLDKFISEYYNVIKYISIMAVIIAVVLFVYIMVISGYNDKGELSVNWIDSIPLEILIVTELIVSGIVLTEGYGGGLGGIGISGFVFMFIMIAIWYLISINIFMSLLSRLKNKVFIKNSIFGKIILAFKYIMKNIIIDMNRKWKAGLIIGSFFFIEFILIMFKEMTGSIEVILLWMLFKIIEFLLLIFVFSLIIRLRNQIKNVYDGNTDNNGPDENMYGIFKESSEYVADISAGLEKAVAEKVKSEKLKAELITNVSHDIKTPLTSIINYIDLMKKEDIDNDKVKEYMEVAYKQSLRLKKLTTDIVEASKAATGNIEAKIEKINICEMIEQSLGEYSDKFSDKNVTPIFDSADKGYVVNADGRLLWRVIDNLFSNICKYALEGTRLYIDVENSEQYTKILIKNISKYELNIPGDELMERFVRGDLSRSTSGNGLGLSIAKSLVEIQNGKFDIEINGDLFTAIIILPKY